MTQSPQAGSLDWQFSADDLERIRAATAAAEEKTSGEIVPYLVERISDHPEIRYKGALFCALLASVVGGGIHSLTGWWGGSGLVWITLPTLLGAVAGWFLATIPGVGRRLVDPDALARRVQLRAKAAFLEEEVFRTEGRTGILIFLALWEHRAVILADEGIHRSVPKGAWKELVDDLVSGVAEGRASEALIGVIERCGDLLERFGVERQPDDEDELSDEPRVRER